MAARQGAGRLAAPLCLLAAALGVGALVCLPAPALAVSVRPNRPPTGGLPWLLVAGGRIVNGLGQTVILRGFNDAALLQTGSQALPAPLSASDAALMEAQGFNVVRIPVSWSMLEPTPGHFSQTYLDQVRAMVALCASHDLYSVLDMHTEDFGVGFGGSGAPAWLSVPGIPDIHFPGLQPAWQRHLSPAVNAALAYFWLYPNWQGLYWAAWQELARAFRNDSAVAAFDLYNEPHPIPIPPAIFATRLLWPFYAAGIAAVSKIDPNHLIVVEGTLFGGLPTAIRPLHAKDLVYSTHLYSGSLLGPTFTGNQGPLGQELEQGLKEAAQLPAPYWAGEIGIDHRLPLAATWARDEIQLSNRHLTGWAWWQWSDAGGWGVVDGQGPTDMDWLDVLSQPFVRAAPGRLLAMAYDVARGRLTASVAGAPTGSLLQVSWPASLGPARLLSSCAARASATRPGSGLVTLRLLAPDCQITLQVYAHPRPATSR
ncbi:MAG TPA: cellulase family glycosylhydrolase [Candidatus Nanopelagicaceae bacterium]|nr:cellulase family glycosylhydrolase [Candidatus Nanopelagicaceae bacterium]